VKDFLQYEQLAARHVEAAYRNLVREVMSLVAADGLPGGHHFYVTFRTRFPGVVVPDYLRSEYPQEMTVVMEHQFWDLAVRDDEFSVTLSFRNQPERLTIPFDAITTFVDPSVKFGVEFHTLPDGAPDAGEESEASPNGDAGGKPADTEGKSAQVVTLDAFRKK